MDNTFEKRVRAGAVAGWWMLLPLLGLILLQYVAYLLTMSSQPTWFLSLWGPNLSWSYVQNIWLLAMLGLKLMLWLLLMGVLWLTLWARQLRKIR